MNRSTAPSIPRRIVATLQLLLRFVMALVVSGARTSGVIVQHGLRLRAPPPSGLYVLSISPMRPQGVALLAAMVSLTPGTTVIDIDTERQEMLIHMLDTRDAETSVADIRTMFEDPLRLLFGNRT